MAVDVQDYSQKASAKRYFGLVPDDWKVVRLKDLCVKITDGAHKTPTYVLDGVPFLRVTDIKNKDIDLEEVKFIPAAEHAELTRRCKPEKGDILLSKNGTVGIPKIIDWDWEFSIFVSLALIKLDREKNCSTEFLANVLASDSTQKQIYDQAKQGTVTNLHLEEIEKFFIPLPPLPEQKKIAAILGSVDDAIAKTESLIGQTRRVKQGLLQELLTRGISHTKFKHTELGEIPEGWELVPLGDVAMINPRKSQTVSDEMDVTFLSMPDVSESAKIVSPQTKKMGDVKKGFTNFVENDVLIAKITPCFENGKGALAIGLVNGIGAGSTEFHILRAGKTILPEIIYLHTIAPKFRNSGEQSMTGSAGQKRVPKEFLQNYRIGLPPLAEQKKIVTIMNRVESAVTKHQSELNSLGVLKKGLMSDLLTGRVRVNAASAKEKAA